jgi:nicotinamidase-related amidase
MSSEPIRDQIADHLLTPKNSALILIDYQPTQVNSIRSMDRQQLVQNSTRVARIASTYGLPIILSTVNVKSGRNQPTIPELIEVLPDTPQMDRTSINAWEDVEFKTAVEATGRKKLIMAALWTEACLSFPTLDALREEYDVYPVADAVGGTSLEAHETALRRMVQAGAKPTSWVQLACELQRDWARTKTATPFADILFGKPNTTGSQ